MSKEGSEDTDCGHANALGLEEPGDEADFECSYGSSDISDGNELGFAMDEPRHVRARDGAHAGEASGEPSATGRSPESSKADSPTFMVPSLRESFLKPLMAGLQDSPPRLAPETSRSADLADLHRIPEAAPLATIATQPAEPGALPPAGPSGGYLSDSQLPSQTAAHTPVFRGPNRSRAAVKQRISQVVRQNFTQGGVAAPGQPSKVYRPRDKAVSLGSELGWTEPDVSASEAPGPADEERGPTSITAYCIAYELDLTALHARFTERFGADAVTTWPEELEGGQTPDILHAVYSEDSDEAVGDVFCFEFGVIVTWGLSSGQEAEVVWQYAGPSSPQRVPDADIEVDELALLVSRAHRPAVRNDTISLPKHVHEDVTARVAVSLALAQSTRISVQETQVVAMVVATKELPAELADTGQVSMPHEELAILMGKVFLQKSALNLQVLSGHKETPKLFWSRPDHLQAIYHAVSDYLDLDERADILNTRFSLLTAMLDLLRDEQSTAHEEQLEWIVIYLIFVTAVLGLLQILVIVARLWRRHSGVGADEGGEHEARLL